MSPGKPPEDERTEPRVRPIPLDSPPLPDVEEEETDVTEVWRLPEPRPLTDAQGRPPRPDPGDDGE